MMNTSFICELCCNNYKTQKTKDRHVCKSNDLNINCQYCSKSFTRLIYKNKHEPKCNMNPNIHLLKQTNTMIENKNPIITNVNITNNINNTNNINQTMINTNNPNNYGYENLDYITDEQLVEMISKRGDGVIKMILLKHFNKLHPENHNVIINGDKCTVYKNDKWKKINRDALVTDLYYDGINSIDVIYEEAVDNNKPLRIRDKDIDFLKYDYEDGNTMELNKEKIDEVLNKNRGVSKINKLNGHNVIL
jgi:hypothetical protein